MNNTNLNSDNVSVTSQVSEDKTIWSSFNPPPHKICVNTREKIFILDVSTIKYLSACGNSTVIHQDTADLTCSTPLSEFERVLAKHSFVRIHRSFLVNLTRVREFRKKSLQIILDEGDCLEVAKNRKGILCDLLYSFV